MHSLMHRAGQQRGRTEQQDDPSSQWPISSASHPVPPPSTRVSCAPQRVHPLWSRVSCAPRRVPSFRQRVREAGFSPRRVGAVVFAGCCRWRGKRCVGDGVVARWRLVGCVCVGRGLAAAGQALRRAEQVSSWCWPQLASAAHTYTQPSAPAYARPSSLPQHGRIAAAASTSPRRMRGGRRRRAHSNQSGHIFPTPQRVHFSGLVVGWTASRPSRQFSHNRTTAALPFQTSTNESPSLAGLLCGTQNPLWNHHIRQELDKARLSK
jgi:hypothetical protein